MSKRVLVTGANGQLGNCIKQIHLQYPEIDFVFLSKNLLDITDKKSIAKKIEQYNITNIINTAAYTQVDKAEEKEGIDLSYNINKIGIKNLAEVSQVYNVELVHLSTDYVFDGQSSTPYKETDVPNPINVYGASKWAGEQELLRICTKSIVLRTSWLYSSYGKNFYTNISNAINRGESLKITTQQTGTPTNAIGLAETIIGIITADNKEYGVYHYSDTGETTWYGFAKAIEIKILGENKGHILPVEKYITKAKRPIYSVLNLDKIKNNFNINPKAWQERLLEI